MPITTRAGGLGGADWGAKSAGVPAAVGIIRAPPIAAWSQPATPSPARSRANFDNVRIFHPYRRTYTGGY